MHRRRGKDGGSEQKARCVDGANCIGEVMGYSVAARLRWAGFLGVALATTLLSPAAMAASCPPTPTIAVQNYPGAARIQNGNDMQTPAGKAVPADGQRVVIYGQLLDTACIPVSDAQIELWQVDPFGKWRMATNADLATPNPVFAGAGRTRTDNNGRFYFITLFPAAAEKRAPHFNLRIGVRGQKPFTTALYFADDGRNATDAFFKRLTPAQRASVTMQVNEAGEAGLQATTQLVTPFKVKYRGY